MPSRPSRPSSGATSLGKVPSSNHFSIPGRIRSWTNFRTVSRISRSSSWSCDSRSRKSEGFSSVRGAVLATLPALKLRFLLPTDEICDFAGTPGRLTTLPAFELRFLLRQETHDPDHRILAQGRFGEVASFDLERLRQG